MYNFFFIISSYTGDIQIKHSIRPLWNIETLLAGDEKKSFDIFLTLMLCDYVKI